MARTQNKKSQSKRKISPFTVLLITTGFLTLFAAAIVIFQNFDIQADSHKEIADAPAGELSFSPEMEDAVNLHPLGSTRLIRVSKSVIELVNLSGSSEDSINTTLASPQIVSMGDYALVFDQGGFQYYLLNRNGLVFSGTVNDPIESAALSPHGLVSLILDRQETNGVLHVLAQDGSLIMEWVALDSQNSGYIIVSDFASDSTYIDVSLLNTNRSDTGSLLNRFSLEKSRLGERIAQYQVDSNSAVIAIINSSERTAFISDRNIYTVNQGALLKGAEFASIYAAAPYGKGAAIIAADTVGGRYKLYSLVDLASVNAGEGLALGENPGIPVSSGRYMAIADGEKVYLITDGKVSKPTVFDLKSNVLSLGLDEHGTILLVTRDEVRRITP